MVSAPDDPFISSLWQCAVKGAENHRVVLDDQHADHDAAAVASETPGVAGVSPAPPTAALRAPREVGTRRRSVGVGRSSAGWGRRGGRGERSVERIVI